MLSLSLDPTVNLSSKSYVFVEFSKEYKMEMRPSPKPSPNPSPMKEHKISQVREETKLPRIHLSKISEDSLQEADSSITESLYSSKSKKMDPTILEKLKMLHSIDMKKSISTPPKVDNFLKPHNPSSQTSSAKTPLRKQLGVHVSESVCNETQRKILRNKHNGYWAYLFCN